MENLPEEVKHYLNRLVQRLVHHLGDRLVGVYLFGSSGYISLAQPATTPSKQVLATLTSKL
jgi:hypothetical protein